MHHRIPVATRRTVGLTKYLLVSGFWVDLRRTCADAVGLAWSDDNQGREPRRHFRSVTDTAASPCVQLVSTGSGATEHVIKANSTRVARQQARRSADRWRQLAMASLDPRRRRGREHSSRRVPMQSRDSARPFVSPASGDPQGVRRGRCCPIAAALPAGVPSRSRRCKWAWPSLMTRGRFSTKRAIVRRPPVLVESCAGASKADARLAPQ